MLQKWLVYQIRIKMVISGFSAGADIPELFVR